MTTTDIQFILMWYQNRHPDDVTGLWALANELSVIAWGVHKFTTSKDVITFINGG